MEFLSLGVSALIGKNYESLTISAPNTVFIPGLSEIPFIGPVFFQQNIIVYVAILMAVLIAFCLNKPRIGLAIRACGENPKAAEALSYSVRKIRYGAVAFGGMMAGVAGAYASTVYTPLWADGMIAGRGWIAVALVVLARGKQAGFLGGLFVWDGYSRRISGTILRNFCPVPSSIRNALYNYNCGFGDHIC